MILDFNYPNPRTFADLRLYLLVFISNSRVTKPPVYNPLNSEFLETQKYTIRWFLQAKVSLVPYNIYIVFLHDMMSWYSFSSVQFSSIQFSCSVVSNSLWHHESPPCPSPTPRVHSDLCPPSQWCHPAISSSVVPFSSCPHSLPASESFPMSQLFTWGGQSTGISALASFLPKKFQGWSPSEWTGWISLQSKGLSRVFSNTTVQKHNFPSKE